MSFNQRRHSDFVRQDQERLEEKVHRSDFQAERHRRSIEEKDRMMREVAEKRNYDREKTYEVATANIANRMDSLNQKWLQKEMTHDQILRQKSAQKNRLIEDQRERREARANEALTYAQ